MACSLVLTVKLDDTQARALQFYQVSGKPRQAAKALEQLFKDLGSQQQRGTIDVQSGSAAPVAASGTFTLASVVATDAITIGPTTFTFTSTPSLSTDVEVDGASDTLDAAALAAAINAHATVSQVVTAEANSAVVTVTAKQKGVAGNFINISSADATITASAANLAGGTGGVTDTAVSNTLGL